MEYDNIVFAYIFGSYVRKQLRSDSDIDIAIYLDKKMDLDTYLDLKMKLTDACKREVDLIILNEATPLLKHQIYLYNRLLFTRDKSMESNFKVKTLFEYNDMKPYLDLSYRKMIERIKREVNTDG
mgnify:FL=1